MRKKISAAIIGSGVACVSVLSTTSASGHGYTDAPTSRQVLCSRGTVQDCGDIQWEPQSVEGPKGFPSRGPSDGTICAGGNSRFAELDDPRGGQWPATQVTAGQNLTFRWRITARHATTDFRYYLTNSTYDPQRPLTRADLATQPFLTVPYGGRVPDATVSHQGTLPAGRTGKQLIVAVWTIADTGNAFYACSDVQF
ncbi:lytic polysaccharide monooxygenase [Streptomyces triculaminicus]|uniref:Lytic polysaccharide monooxygenase n=2 Tax=Streptomyces TaxID=1883 RepID=A0A939FIW2_9ACTN|nr:MULTISPECIES: lytic polysaccharide monooxygenase [Streptomyces]MBO0651559.1 lytic polysaccharide monooxygenase [Streptomyces triculaminicus]QSY47469.1 lytic polysaccharide monooxygenase [Streptomyces griseocarneus]